MSPECPECALFIDLGDKKAFPTGVIANEIVVCPDCGVELEVRAIEGGEQGDGVLKKAPKVGEDWGE